MPKNETGPSVFYSPIWHVAPRSDEQEYIMFNQASDAIQRTALGAMFTQKSMVSSEIFLSQAGSPQFARFFPIFDSLERNRVVASLSLLTDIAFMFGMIESTNNTSIDVVLDSSCGQQFTFRILAENSTAPPTAILLGEGDLHDPAFDAFKATFTHDQGVKVWNEIVSKAPKEVSKFYKERAPSKTILKSEIHCGTNDGTVGSEESQMEMMETRRRAM